jgi:TATA-box binding protein (TBP) (component of TFIID and TFIIIB)
MTSFKWNTYNFTDYINYKENEMVNLPPGVLISTITASAKRDEEENGLGTNVNNENIFKYLKLNTDDILMIKKDKEKKRSIIPEKKKKRRTKKTKVTKKQSSHFYHQITVVVRVFEGEYEDLNDVKKINFKVFKNGSIQMSGIKKLEYVNRAINKLIYRLKQVKGILVTDEETGKKSMKEIKFVEEPDKLNLKNFKLDMINSNYTVNMHIDRKKLYNILLNRKVNAIYEQLTRACVIVKYMPREENPNLKEISIFIFQKGNIIITGAKSKKHITAAYNYLNNILLNHKNEIIKKTDDEEKNELMNLYDSVMTENSHKIDQIMEVGY